MTEMKRPLSFKLFMIWYLIKINHLGVPLFVTPGQTHHREAAVLLLKLSTKENSIKDMTVGTGEMAQKSREHLLLQT